MKTLADVNPRFGKAMVGDHIVLPSPLAVGAVEGLLVDIQTGSEGKGSVHHYKLYLFGVDIGDAYAWNNLGLTVWEVE